jgi:aromatic ring-opening dioxygenase catalytic subunit (LigB family)
MEKMLNPNGGDIIYLSHGGGPIPILGGFGHEKMIVFMKRLGSELPRPDEILVISAHWEESIPTIINAEFPKLYYDYYGFPEEAYTVKYPAPGHPELAEEILNLLRKNNNKAKTDSNRGLDHGVFIPLIMMYPQADIPVTQLSLIKGLDPQEHFSLGKALRPLMKRNILIIGSGFSFHNMSAFSMVESEIEDPRNNVFQEWLKDTCSGSHDEVFREQSLVGWTSAPNARYCHPREEHLIPLHVCQGIAENDGDIIFDDYIAGKRSLAIKW